jgi:uncharacterized protein YabE (DUF348 family)
MKKIYIIQLLVLLLILTLITVIIIKRKTINLVIDGKKSTITTYKGTVSKALENNGITVDSKDKINVKLDSKTSNKSTITIKRAVNVQVSVDGKELKIKSAENTVEALFKVEGITLKNMDKVNPSKATVLTDGMKINVVRVETKTFTNTADISFKTVIKNNNNLANSIKKTIQEGKVGQKATTINVIYENGKEVSRTIVKETIVRKPVDKVISQGTLPVLPISRGGDPIPYTKVFKARATAYHAINGIGHTYSASGRLCVRDSNSYSTIAVDPSIIPLGSRVYVEGYGLAYAADTGTAIKGNTIDVFFNTLQEVNNWAIKSVNVYILK